MTMDFDFKHGKRHYKGRGILGLVGLAMMLLIPPLLWIGGGTGITYWLKPSLIDGIRGYLGL
jgi:hypothetical protein